MDLRTGLATVAAGTTVEYDNATGQMGPMVSSLRFKTNISDLELDSSKIYELKAKSFNYKSNPDGQKQIGYIAEEVDLLYPELVPKDITEEPYSVRYQLLTVLLVEEIKKLKQRIEVLESQK